MQRPITLFEHLRSIFPGQTVDYIKRATSFILLGNNLENFVTNGINGSFPDMRLFPPDPSVDNYLRDIWVYMKEVLPDAEESFLSLLFQEYAGTKQLQEVIADATAKRSYPKRCVTIKVNKFDVKKYCELIPDPEGSYSHRNYIMSDAMKQNAVAYLQKIFQREPDLSLHDEISSTVNRLESLYLSFKSLSPLYLGGKNEVKVNVKTTQPETFVEPDYELVFEKLFIENEAEVLKYIRNKIKEKEAQFVQLLRNNLLKTCPVCISHVSPADLPQICQSGHAACKNCIKTDTELHFFDNCLYFRCLFCDLYISNKIVMSVWDSVRFSQLLQMRIQREKPDYYPCPSCYYLTNDKNDEVVCVHCQYRFCQKCRKCAHTNLACHQYENNLCKEIEESMSKELIRNCPVCHTPIIKESGDCNRVQCKCGIYMCYVCRKAVPEGSMYRHFHGQGCLPSEKTDTCPLYSDTNNLHVSSVINKGKMTKKQILEKNPGVKLSYDPLKVLPQEKESDLPPDQY